MTTGQIILRLTGDTEFSDIMDEAARTNDRFLRDLATGLIGRKHADEALEICDLMLGDNPDDLDALLLSVRAFATKGCVEQALQILLDIRKRGLDTETVQAATQAELVTAAHVHGLCLAADDFARAVKICDLLVELCPGVLLFHRARLDTIERAQRHNSQRAIEIGRQHYRALTDLADVLLTQNDLAAELRCRLELHRHPTAPMQHSAMRVTTIAHALSRILAADIDAVDAERLGLAQELLTALTSIPINDPVPGNIHGEPVAAWERTMRLLLGTIDLGAIFQAPAEATPALPISFFSTSGVELSIEDIAARSRDLAAKVLFVTSSSAEYFNRHAKTYVSSILRACDCSCLIFIYVCEPKKRLREIVSGLDVDDPRVIFGADDFDAKTNGSRLFTLARKEPSDIPGPYYASSGLLHMDNLLQNLGLPVCVSGIDTVLQRGVVDLIERFGGADVVLNKMNHPGLLGSQIVNNLVLVYPTENGLLFSQFLKSYLGGHLARADVPEFLDQLDVHMAKHHVMANGILPVIRYFDPFDINNEMFSRLNYHGHVERMRSYRFLNIFAAGCQEDAMGPEDVTGGMEDHVGAAPPQPMVAENGALAM